MAAIDAMTHDFGSYRTGRASPNVLERVHVADLTRVLGETEVKNKLATVGAYVQLMSPAQVKAFAEEQQQTWLPIAQKVAREMAESAK